MKPTTLGFETKNQRIKREILELIDNTVSAHTAYPLAEDLIEALSDIEQLVRQIDD